jgi:Domain of unknown function (DUF4349)
MTMIDEQALSDSIRDAAESIEVPEGATERILAASRVAPLETRASRPRVGVRGGSRRRWVLYPVVVALVVAGIAVSMVGSHSNPFRSGIVSGLSAGPTVHGGSSGSAAPLPSNGATQPPTGAAGAGSSSSGTAAPSASAPPLPPGSVGQSAKVESKGSINLTIGDGKLQSVLAKLTDLAVGAGGFVASSENQVGAGGSGPPSSGTIVLRIPESSFASTVSRVQQDGHATSVTTSSTDVTGEYVDLQARITALQASRQQYLTIMTQATSIGDILAVQSQLDTLQSQIEQLQGQLSVLTDETNYGTLTVSVVEAGQRPIPPVPPRTGLDKAWHDGIGGFVSGFEWLLRIAGTTLFVLLCLAALIVVGRWAWGASRRRLL